MDQVSSLSSAIFCDKSLHSQNNVYTKTIYYSYVTVDVICCRANNGLSYSYQIQQQSMNYNHYETERLFSDSLAGSDTSL